MIYNKLKKQNIGFSLIEITLVLSIFIFLVIISTEFIIRGLRSNTFADEQNSAVQSARKSADVMVKEIRKANQAETGNYLLETVNPQSFIFYADIDDDGKTERVRYFLDNKYLKKGVIAATNSPAEYPGANEQFTILSDYVNNNTEALFNYYDKNDVLLADPTSLKRNIRMINMNIKINVTPERAPNDYYIRANVQIRNLKDNL
jgi:type II secretory pathway pseudopilin PulG